MIQLKDREHPKDFLRALRGLCGKKAFKKQSPR